MEKDQKPGSEVVNLNLADLEIDELDARLEMARVLPSNWACGTNGACNKN